MRIKIDFEEIPEIDVRTVSVIGSFNNYDETVGIMRKEGNVWSAYVDLGQGEHYYKFLINHEIKLNDPNTNVYLPICCVSNRRNSEIDGNFGISPVILDLTTSRV